MNIKDIVNENEERLKMLELSHEKEIEEKVKRV